MELSTFMFTYAFEPFTRVEHKETGQGGVLTAVMQMWNQDRVMYCLVPDGTKDTQWVDQHDLLTEASVWKVIEKEDGSAKSE